MIKELKRKVGSKYLEFNRKHPDLTEDVLDSCEQCYIGTKIGAYTGLMIGVVGAFSPVAAIALAIPSVIGGCLTEAAMMAHTELSFSDKSVTIVSEQILKTATKWATEEDSADKAEA